MKSAACHRPLVRSHKRTKGLPPLPPKTPRRVGSNDTVSTASSASLASTNTKGSLSAPQRSPFLNAPTTPKTTSHSTTSQSSSKSTLPLATPRALNPPENLTAAASTAISSALTVPQFPSLNPSGLAQFALNCGTRWEAALQKVDDDIFTVPSQHQTIIMNTTDMKRRAALLDRLAEYEGLGLLSKKDYLNYCQLLQIESHANYYIRQVNKDLDQIATVSPRGRGNSKPRSKEQASSSPLSETDDSPSKQPQSILKKKRGGEALAKKHQVSWEDQSKSSDSSSFTADKENAAEKRILEPADLWNGNLHCDELELQELFVEMCFYARLGYVQPPHCLKCTYMKTIQGGSHNNRHCCNRWVVWRKNAETLLHPNLMDGNIIIVQCPVAKELLEGKEVEGYVWDAARKQVLTASR